MSDAENLKMICDQITSALSEQVDRANPDELTGKLQVLSSLLGTSAQSIATSERLYSIKLMELVEDTQWAKMTATDKKYLFAGKSSKEAELVTLCERLNKAIVHSIDSLRSILSFIKSEMQNLPNN